MTEKINLMQKKIFIGLVGEKGGGKGSFATLFERATEDLRVERIKFSALLGELLDIIVLEKSRENLRKMAYLINEWFGIEAFSNAVCARASKSQADIVILDGLRWPTDFECFQKLPNSILVYVTADPKVRYERIITRGEKSGEMDLSFKEFQKEEEAYNEQFIPQYGKKAEYIIEHNSNDWDIFTEQIKEFRDWLNKKFEL